MAKKSTTVQEPSAETRDEVLRVILASAEPVTVKSLSTLLTAPHAITEKQLVPVLLEFVTAGTVFELPPESAKGKPRYWGQDLTAMCREAVQSVVHNAVAPLTAADVIALLSLPGKVNEANVVAVLQPFIDGGTVFQLPPEKPKGKPRYWNKDVKALASALVMETMPQTKAPVTAKDLAAQLPGSVKFTEADLNPILDDAVSAKTLYLTPPEKTGGKPRYWDRDLAALGRELITETMQRMAAPVTAKDLAGQIIGQVKFSETDLIPILDDAVSAKTLYLTPPEKTGGKPRYWDRDLTALGRELITETMQRMAAPVTAKDLAGQIIGQVKFSETDLIPLLDDAVASRTLQVFEPTTAKTKPRYWDRDIVELGRITLLKAIEAKGPQTQVNLKKLAKGLTDPQFQDAFQSLVDSKKILRHPPLGTAKQEAFGVRPPALEPYLKDVAKQLIKVVDSLTTAGISRDDLRQALVQVIESAGIPFGSALHQSNASNSGAHSSKTETSDKLASVNLIDLMKRAEPGAERGALVGARELRRLAQLSKSEFDSAVLELAQAGKISLHRHDFAASLTPAERDELVTDGVGSYYIGMAIRHSEG